MKPIYRLLISLALLSAAAFAQSTPQADSPQAIHQSAIVIDTHADTPQRFLDENFDLSQDTPVSDGHMDFGKIRKGNLAGEFFSIWVEPTFKGQYAHRAMALIDSVYQQAARHPDKMVMAFTADDIVRAHQQHKFAALLGIEGGHAIENDPRLLREFYRLGVRYMTLTWSNTNEWGDSSGDINNPEVKHHSGLTDFGKDVVREMNRLGMMVDISHVADATFFQTLVVSRAPVIASHSSSRQLTSHPRNMTDDMLRAVALNDGVVMVNFYSAFIDQNYLNASSDPAKVKARDDELAAYAKAHPHADGSPLNYNDMVALEKKWAAQFPRPPLKSLIDHIDHVAKVAGIDHVGLGSDFDGVTSLPEGIDSVADLPKITQALFERGYNRRQIHKLLGGNILRVMRQVEKVSREMQAERKASEALTFEEIQLMLGNYVTPAHLIDMVRERGVNFELTPERREQLKAAKATDEALDAIGKAKRK